MDIFNTSKIFVGPYFLTSLYYFLIYKFWCWRLWSRPNTCFRSSTVIFYVCILLIFYWHLLLTTTKQADYLMMEHVSQKHVVIHLQQKYNFRTDWPLCHPVITVPYYRWYPYYITTIAYFNFPVLCNTQIYEHFTSVHSK